LPASEPAPTIDGVLPISLPDLAAEKCSAKILAQKNPETRSAFVFDAAEYSDHMCFEPIVNARALASFFATKGAFLAPTCG
jgi:hypothetical protein